jgi:hypothetical protein
MGKGSPKNELLICPLDGYLCDRIDQPTGLARCVAFSPPSGSPESPKIASICKRFALKGDFSLDAVIY